MNKVGVVFIFLEIALSAFSTNIMAEGCIVTRYISYYEMTKNKLSKIDTIELKIENRIGEEYTNIEIPYSKHNKIANIDAWIVDNTGQKIRSLKKSEIFDKSNVSDMSLYEDNFIKTFQLKYNFYPYKVCYTYKTTIDQFIMIADWSPALYSKIPTIEARLVVSLPKECRYKIFKRDVMILKSDTSENNIKTTYIAKYKKIDLTEPYSESFEELKPRLVIVPFHFNYGVDGSTTGWKEFGDWFNKLNKGLNDLPLSEKNIVYELIKNEHNQKEVIKILYHYMQDHTRYINVSIGLGGFKSYPASYVAQNKYGDCKALTNYMKSLLEIAGIKSYFVLIYRSFGAEKIIVDLPFPQFNHVLLAVPMNKDTIWIENTENSEAFNFISCSIQNRKALFIDENNSKIISMPALRKSDVTMYRKIEIKLDKQGNAEANSLFSFRGFSYEYFNSLTSDFNKDEQDNIIKEYLPFSNYEVWNWKLNKIDRDTSRIELVTRLGLNKVLNQIGEEFYFNTFPIKKGVFSPPTERNLPLRFDFPIQNIDSVVYIIPDGLEVKSVPEDLAISTQFGNFESHIKWDSNRIRVTKKFELIPNYYTLEQYKLFYEFHKLVVQNEKHPIILKKKLNSI